MNRPKGLALSVVLMGLCNVMLWAAFNPATNPRYLRLFILLTVVICIGFAIIWFYWQGKNWARIIVLIVSALSVLNLRIWNTVSLSSSLLVTPTHVLLASRALLGAVLLFWLNTRSVREFFKSRSEVQHLAPKVPS